MLMRFSEFYPNHLNLSRHWCPLSQRYTGVDALLSRLDNGWKIWGDIDFDEYWFGESRHTLIYHFMLIKQDNRVTMHVLHNPVLDRLLTQPWEKPISSRTSAQASRSPHLAGLPNPDFKHVSHITGTS